MRRLKNWPFRFVFIYLLVLIGLTNSILGLITGKKQHILRFLNLSPESLVFHEPQFFWDKQLKITFVNGQEKSLSFAEVKKLDPTNSLFHAVLFGPSIPKEDRDRIVNFTLCSPAKFIHVIGDTDRVAKVSLQYSDRTTHVLVKELEWQCPI